MTMTVKDQFKAARRFGVPLIAVETPDMAATIAVCAAADNGNESPLFTWNVVDGLRPLNKRGEAVIEPTYKCKPADLAAQTINPTEMLLAAAKLPPGACVFMLNAHLFYGQESTLQATWNLRDTFKASRRTLVLLGAAIHLPPELANDVLVFDEPLPSDAHLAEIAQQMYDLIGLTRKMPTAMLAETVRASRGLSAFAAEQAIAMSLTRQGIDARLLWEHKRHMVEQTKGLRVYTGGETFDDIGGIEHIKEFGRRLFAKTPPSAIIWVDEIEKAMAGSSGAAADTSGTSQDQLGQLLTEMQNNEWAGMILPGPPGCAKSLFAKALGTTYQVPCIALDLGAMKGSLVGQSEQQIRAALKVIKAVAGKGAYWVATCNRMEHLPPELRRRFTDSIWFFDLPDEKERASIWAIMRRRFGIPLSDPQPVDLDWTGADIRNVCSIAQRLDIPLVEASSYITPVAKSDPRSIERLRRLANESFLSASKPGLYRYGDDADQPVAGGRVMSV